MRNSGVGMMLALGLVSTARGDEPPTRVDVHELTVAPSTAARLDAVRKVFEGLRPGFARCFGQRSDQQQLALPVRVVLAVDKAGKVTEATTSGTTDAAFIACVTPVLRAATFPRPGAAVTVTASVQLWTEAAAGDLAAGLDDRDAQGGLDGSEAGEMQGGYGYGVADGGTTTGLGTIGTGRYGTGGPPPRVAPPTKVKLGEASVKGPLDKAIVRRYMRQKLPQIDHCYAKALQTRPKLKGTVKARFTIAETGVVVEAAASGSKVKDLDACVVDAIRSIQFPRPKGGPVQVVYPFTFAPT